MFVGVVQQCHLTGFFDFDRKFLLMFGAGSGEAAGRDFAALSHESFHQSSIFVVDQSFSVLTEKADPFFEDEILLVGNVFRTTAFAKFALGFLIIFIGIIKLLIRDEILIQIFFRIVFFFFYLHYVLLIEFCGNRLIPRFMLLKRHIIVGDVISVVFGGETRLAG